MGIWAYEDFARDKSALVHPWTCPFCKHRLATLENRALHDESEHSFDGATCTWVRDRELDARVCPVCGWWSVRTRSHDFPVGRVELQGTYATHGAAGSLLELDLTDLRAPIADVRDFLAARYDSRFYIHPRLFEETVASVFSDLGYSVQVTAYSGDGGIDVILDRSGCQVGVQVKRHRDKIKVEQIRALVGALVLKGLTSGVFVTTSGFQTGAEMAADTYSARGCPVELVDAARFFELLSIAQRANYRHVGDLPLDKILGHLAVIDVQSAY